MIIFNHSLKHISALIFSSILVIGYSSAQASELAAKVIWVKGNVKVITPTQASGTTLARGSELHEGDTIITAADGSGLITFTDQSIVALAQDTQLKISAYNYDKSDKTKEKYTITLVKGGLRTITGLIAKDNRDAYQVKTPTATIGVRGTHFAAATHQGKAAAIVSNGTIVFKYSGQTIHIMTGHGAFLDKNGTLKTATATQTLIKLPLELRSTFDSLEQFKDSLQQGYRMNISSTDTSSQNTICIK